jgi:cell division protein FtsQ
VRKRARTDPASIGAQAIAVAVTLGAAALIAFGFKEASDPRFAYTGMAVKGEAQTPAAQIVDAAGFAHGANVWLLDTGGAQRRIEALPWVDAAIVRRSWPNRVTVSVEERSPVVRVRVRQLSAEEPVAAEALVDATGRVLDVSALGSRDPHEEQAAALPLIRLDPPPGGLSPGAAMPGDDFQLAYDALVQLRALGLRVSEIDVKPAFGISVTSDAGVRAILGSEDDLARKVTLFKAIVPKIAAPENVVYVDLRSVRAPTVLYR